MITLVLQAAGALSIVLALIIGLQLCVARFPRKSAAANGLLAVEEQLAIDQRRRIVVLRVGERRVLLLVGGGSDSNLGWLP